MPATLFGLPAVEVVQPDGEITPYILRDAEPNAEELRAWKVVKADGTASRVSLYVRDGPHRIRCDSRGWWGCDCKDFEFRRRKVRFRSATSGCKHTDSVRDMLSEEDGCDGPANDRGAGEGHADDPGGRGVPAAERQDGAAADRHGPVFRAP